METNGIPLKVEEVTNDEKPTTFQKETVDSTVIKSEENDVTTNDETVSTNQMKESVHDSANNVTDKNHHPKNGETVDSTIIKTEENDVTTNDTPVSTDSTNQIQESVHDSANKITDEYHYTKSGEYTSEMFKVVVQNIPARVTYGVRSISRAKFPKGGLFLPFFFII